MDAEETLVHLLAENSKMRAALGLSQRDPNAGSGLRWLERENEMLAAQISVFKKCQKMLRTKKGKQEALFALQFFHSIPLPLWVSDIAEKIGYWNKFAERTYQHAEDKALGKNFIEMFVSEPEKQQARDDLFAIIYGQEGLEHFNLCKDKDNTGKQVYLVTCCFPVYDPRTNGIVQAELSFDLRRVEELEAELEDMYKKYKRREEEAAALRAQKDQAVISRLIGELFDELQAYCVSQKADIESRVKRNQDMLSGKTTTTVEKTTHEVALNANQGRLTRLLAWEREMKKDIAEAPETILGLEGVREIIRQGVD